MVLAQRTVLCLTVSTNNLSIDAGFTGTGSIGDYVWEDTNGDGLQDESGTGIDGVDVALTWYGPDGVLGGGDDVVYPTTTTIGGGDYVFDNLPPGVYVVDVVGGQPSGSTLTTSNDPTAPITLTGGQDYVDADFGYQPATASIGDYVFIDINNGNYLFAGVPAGNYYVVFTAPSGYQVSGVAPEGDNANNITGLNGAGSTDSFVFDGVTNNLSIDAGFTGTGSIGDYVWEDTNGDGIQDESGTGIDGVDVALTWYGPDGVLGGGDDVLYPTTTTSGGGNYIFDNLPPGVYVVDVVGGQPSGSSLTTGNDPTAPITLIGGQDYVDADFGYQPATASIGDYAFIDINNDGIYNGSDQPLSGVTATLYDATTNMATSFTDVTDASGNYLFAGVPAGNYYVVFTTPSGYQVSGVAPEGDNANNITGLNGAGSTDSFVFDGVTNNLSIDAGFTGTGSIGDYVWEDTNGDGIQDESGTGIDGVDVALTWYGPDGVLGGGDDVLYPTTTTSGGGNYIFDNLPPGVYVVDVVGGQPSGSSLTTGNDPTAPITLIGGQDYVDADFGYQPVALPVCVPNVGTFPASN
ncbi:MAG: hypothetical protein IPL35_08875 [Sphingobacteriales bacterium]|nr:hypothetical protein [Sphingobacteriales bacterium]